MTDLLDDAAQWGPPEPPEPKPDKHPRCEMCGRFMRKVENGIMGAYWRCPKIWYDGEGGWEHD